MASPGVRRLIEVFAGIAAVLLLSACTTVSSQEAREAQLEPSGLQVVGQVIWVDAAEGNAVVRLERGVNVSGQRMIARNDALFETAQLESADLRQGQTLGVRIVEGLPNSGDEVVMARSAP